MNKIVSFIALFLMYALAFSPATMHWYCPHLIWGHVNICIIFKYVMAFTALCCVLSLIAFAFKAYRIGLIIAWIPLFIEGVLFSSALLLFMFHKEFTAAIVVGKIRAIGAGIFSVLKAPLTVFQSR